MVRRMKNYEPTVNVLIRFPESLYRKLIRLREKHRRSLNHEVIEGLREYASVADDLDNLPRSGP